MSDRQSHSDETKAAVMAALLTGQSINEVARAYQIPRGTVASWSREISRPSIQDDTQKRAIGDLLIGYVKESLHTLQAQVKAVGDEEWIKKQPASEIAVLHGVIADKTIRLLEALATSEDDPVEGDSPS